MLKINRGIASKIQPVLIILVLFSNIFAGTTGKVTGIVVDEITNTGLPGVNVVVEGTSMGAATDVDGYFTILNVPPGVYTVKAMMIGYSTLRMTNVQVSIDLTTEVNFNLPTTVLEVGKEVVITAERPVVVKDLTSTLFTVGAEQIAAMPVEDFTGVLELQAGMVKGHMRGGRAGEMAYFIDGVSVTDVYSGDKAIEIENTAIQELQIISGTFDAEYGQAMSGIVNIITKDGGKEYSGSLDIYAGDYYGKSSETFINLDKMNITSIVDVQANLNGPVPLFNDRLSFFTSGRYYSNDGWIYGQRIYKPADYIYKTTPDTTVATGDRSYVSMNPLTKISLQGKLTAKITNMMKLRFGMFLESKEFKNYDNDSYGNAHKFRYNPDGIYKRFADNYNYNLTLNHALNAKTFYDLSLTQFSTDNKFYVYEDPLNSLNYDDDLIGYIDPTVFNYNDAGFYIGGTEMWHFYRTTKSSVAKMDVTSQVTRGHKMKLGIEGRFHDLSLHEFEIVPKKNDAGIIITPFTPDTLSRESYNNNRYRHKPIEFSGYIQDKMEFDDMIVNIGVRFDYFNPDGKVPVDLFDPHNDNDNENAYKDAKSKMQFSPRFGIAFPISDKGVIHFSYGHFFQIPTFEFLYVNSEFEVTPGGLSSKIGNADLDPQKTVIYEVGLQQELIPGLGLDITGFFKDIRNLLGTEIQKTFDQKKYARYVNRDYGNVKGITIALDKSLSYNLSASVDYTYQVAEGNASDPDAVYFDNRSEPPRESEKQVVPLDWDQNQTLNLVITYAVPKNWGISLLGKMGSGLPYTPEFAYQRTGFENSERKPTQYNFDLKVSKDIWFGKTSVRVFAKIYNLFNRRNENDVYKDTGRAGYTLVDTQFSEAYLTEESYYARPDFFSEPRQIRFGLSFQF